MKELSIEQKAKAYDKVREKIALRFGSNVAEEIFSEYEMSEGEKIKKDVKRAISVALDYSYFDKETANNCLAWLEKQISNNIKWNKNTKDNKPQVNHSVLMQTIYGIAEGEWQGKDWYQYRWSGIIKDNAVIAWIELSDVGKQSKESKVEEAVQYLKENHSPSEISDFQTAMNIAVAKAYDKGMKDGLEKQVSVDEDEIVEGIRRGVAISLINHIDANSKGMCLSNMECEDIENAIINEDWDKVYGYMKKKLEKQGEPIDKIEPKFHEGEWIVLIATGSAYQVEKIKNYEYTLRHISGGSVRLSDEKLIREWTIQDAKDGDVLVDVYGNIGIYEQCDDFDWVSCCSLGHNGGFQHFNTEHENEKTYPATKSQCNALIKAMADAGWEFDFEKKELKKLSQQEVTKISDQVKDSAWSEEDGHRAEDTIYFLDTAKKHYASTVELDACIDWLKSLKQRIGG